QHDAAPQRVRQQLLKLGGEIERPGERNDRLPALEPAANASGGVFGADEERLRAVVRTGHLCVDETRTDDADRHAVRVIKRARRQPERDDGGLARGVGWGIRGW